MCPVDFIKMYTSSTYTSVNKNTKEKLHQQKIKQKSSLYK